MFLRHFLLAEVWRSGLVTGMPQRKENIYEHIQWKGITDQQATTEHMQQGVAIHSSLKRRSSDREKGPFLCFYFPHASLMYRHESNDFFYLLAFYFYILMPWTHLFGFLTFSSASAFFFSLSFVFFLFFFNKTELHLGHDMKMNNPFRGLSSGSALNINRKEKYYKGLILTGNRHKQQVGESERDFSYNVTGNLLLHDWAEGKRLGLGPV